MQRLFSEPIPALFVVNLCLQVWDGLATYHGLQLGVKEANPLVRVSIAYWGVGWALILWKVMACFFLCLLRCLGTGPRIANALAITATSYFSFSLLPWAILLFL